MSKKTEKAIGGEQPFDFEEGMRRLEEIIALFDEGGLKLAEMESYFSEGMDLVKKCGGRLDEVEARVTRLIRESQEQWSEEPFGGADEP